MVSFSIRGDMRSHAHLIVIVYFFGQAGIAQAANNQQQWLAVSTPKSEHVHFYLDKASIRKAGPLTSARVLYDFNKPQLNEDFGTYPDLMKWALATSGTINGVIVEAAWQ
jgi:hypothetical protein